MLLSVVLMVKDEASAIEKTLLPFVKAGIRQIVVLDTGSTDNTVSVTREFFSKHQVQGCVYEEPFVTFSVSRNRALELTENYFPDTTFILMIDAEWVLHYADKLLEFCEQEKHAPTKIYLMKIHMLGFQLSMAILMRASAKNRYKGEVHEVAELVASVHVPNPVYFDADFTTYGIEKSRRRWTFDRDFLLKSFQQNPDDPRTSFYLGQTYHTLGDLQKAYEFYQIRSKLIGFDEENFVTLYRLGCLAHQMMVEGNTSYSWSTAMNYYLKAYESRPTRIEPIVKIAQHYLAENLPTCFSYISKVYDVPFPDQETLFIEKRLYNYTRHELMSRCAWSVGQYQLGKIATLRALEVHPEYRYLHEYLKLYSERA